MPDQSLIECTQIEEKKLAHRHTTDVPTVISDGPASVAGTFGTSAIREVLETNEQQSSTSPFVEEQDTVRAELQAQRADFCIGPNNRQLKYNTISVQPTITPEMARTFKLFQHCLELRDKYIAKSLQRLGDNPRDHDGHFNGIAEGFAGVACVRPDVDFAKARVAESSYKAWKIYPKPPPPHWHFTPEQDVPAADDQVTTENEEFELSNCQIPESHSWEFRIDDKGVYQVHSTAGGTHGNSCALMQLIIYHEPQMRNHCLTSHLSGNISSTLTMSLGSYPMVRPKALHTGDSNI